MAKTFEKINGCLAEYYTNLGNNTYYQNDHRGLFLAAVEDQAFDEDDLGTEIMNSATKDCMLLDWDPNFPTIMTINNNIFARQQEMHRVLQIIYQHGHTKPLYIKKINRIHKTPNDIKFQSTNHDKKVAQKLYKSQVNEMLGANGLNEDGLMEFLTIGVANGLYPFLSTVVDCYTRDRIRIKYNNNNLKTLDVYEWSPINPFMKALKLSKPQIAQGLQAAIYSYCKRISPKMTLIRPIYQIQDNLTEVCQYIFAATEFIAKLVKFTTPPIQMDWMIGFAQTMETTVLCQPTLSDDDDPLLIKELDAQNDDAKQQKYHNNDVIGDICDKLKYEKCAYATHQVKDNDLAINLLKRVLTPCWSDYRAELAKKGNHDLLKYPHRKRFNVFIDRRYRNMNKKDKITIFEPPSNCDKIPARHIPEWFHQSSRLCLIPRKGYNNNKLNNDQFHGINHGIQKKKKSSTISTQTPLDGKLMTFSFHVEAADQIKCYLCWNKSILRFYPQDIIEVLPSFFNPNIANNGTFADKVLAKKIIICDAEFEQFYRLFSNVSTTEFPKYTK